MSDTPETTKCIKYVPRMTDVEHDAWRKSHQWKNISSLGEQRRGFNTYKCVNCGEEYFVDSSD